MSLSNVLIQRFLLRNRVNRLFIGGSWILTTFNYTFLDENFFCVKKKVSIFKKLLT